MDMHRAVGGQQAQAAAKDDGIRGYSSRDESLVQVSKRPAVSCARR